MRDIYSEYYLWVLFSQTQDAISKARQRELVPYHISGIRAALLFIIKLIGYNATPGKIARWLFREHHTISEIINRMEKQGFLKKVKDLDRKNQVRIELTEKGWDCYNTSLIPLNIPKIFSVLSDEERRRFILYVTKIRKAALKYAGIQYEIPLPPVDNDSTS